MGQPITMQQLNGLSAAAFTSLLADVFEHSPWVAERAAPMRPFTNVEALHRAMIVVLEQANEVERLALLRAHPELAGREAQEGALTSASAGEQSRAGLDALSKSELAQIMHLNSRYHARHGFPFIVCVGRHTKSSILTEFERRLNNATDDERGEALAQVALIARLRLASLITE
ncbi:MAG: 2-oxo-4-hydroxy-4-carboxy-5-ureidoimidazoline decarboxylase [Burkholderiaceae bacterium]